MLIDDFHKVETDEDLFEVKDNNLFVWDIFRLPIYYRYRFLDRDVKALDSTKNNPLKFRKVIKLLSSILYHLFFIKKSDFLVLTSSRYKAKSGEYYDKATIDVINLFKDRSTIIETFSIAKLKYRAHYSLLSVLMRLKKAPNLSYNVYEYIKNSFIKHFGVFPLLYDDMNLIYKKYQISYKYYSYLINRTKCSKILLGVGNPNAVVHAAKDNHISTFLFQHGEVASDMIEFSYPDIDIHGRNYFPDYFLTFSSLWGKGCNIPGITMPIGNNQFVIRDNTKGGIVTSDIVFISSYLHSDYLKFLCREYARNNPNRKLIYKLHPDEQYQADKFKDFFKEEQNVIVISNEVETSLLIVGTNTVVLISSTVLFMTIDLNKKVAIYAKAEYERNLPHVNNINIFLFDSIDDLNKIVLTKIDKEVGAAHYYEPFDASLLYNVLI